MQSIRDARIIRIERGPRSDGRGSLLELQYRDSFVAVTVRGFDDPAERKPKMGDDVTVTVAPKRIWGLVKVPVPAQIYWREQLLWYNKQNEGAL